jgi:hypothetical protein
MGFQWKECGSKTTSFPLKYQKKDSHRKTRYHKPEVQLFAKKKIKKYREDGR